MAQVSLPSKPGWPAWATKASKQVLCHSVINGAGLGPPAGARTKLIHWVRPGGANLQPSGNRLCQASSEKASASAEGSKDGGDRVPAGSSQAVNLIEPGIAVSCSFECFAVSLN